jgi:hypothetical protein
MKWRFSKCFQVVVGQKTAFFVFIHFHGGEFIKIISYLIIEYLSGPE